MESAFNKNLINEIKAESLRIKEEVIETRRHIHMHPEIGFDTVETEKLVRHKLSQYGVEILPSKLGVLAKIEGKSRDNIIALRADMDALCLEEQTDVHYKSVYPNRMHACGHDGHTAMLLGSAKIINKYKECLPNDVLLIFQPAEEGPNLGGARIILKDIIEMGIADRISYMFGIHLFNDFPVGKVGVKDGSLMASTDEFDIKIIGKGGHAGLPHETIDALSVATKFVCAVESMMSKRIDPFDPAVCSFGLLNAGSAKNVVADYATMAGTIRCQKENTRILIKEQLETILKGICSAHGATFTLNILDGLPVLVNDRDATSFAQNIVENVVGKENTFTIPKPVMGSEDFAYYSQRIKSSFLWLGSGNKEKGFTYLGHHPKFNFDEDALITGTNVLTALAFGII